MVEFGFPTTPAKELALDCVGVRAEGANANGLILGIDLGKYKSVLCDYEPSAPSRQTAGLATSQALPQVLGKEVICDHLSSPRGRVVNRGRGSWRPSLAAAGFSHLQVRRSGNK
jgi:hypothetical protein